MDSDSQSQTYTKEQIDFINQQIQAGARMVARVEKEILALFTKMEISLVNSIWGRSKKLHGMSIKDRLIYQITEVIPEQVLLSKWNVNKQEVIKKINELTWYQAFILIKVSAK